MTARECMAMLGRAVSGYSWTETPLVSQYLTPEKKAEKLLLRWLTEEQREEFRQHRHITVRGSDGYRYRVEYCQFMNVIRLPRYIWQWNVRYCGYLADNDYQPLADNILGIILMLSCHARKFRLKAHRYTIVNDPGRRY
jgi:hypothetical protein